MRPDLDINEKLGYYSTPEKTAAVLIDMFYRQSVHFRDSEDLLLPFLNKCDKLSEHVISVGLYWGDLQGNHYVWVGIGSEFQRGKGLNINYQIKRDGLWISRRGPRNILEVEARNFQDSIENPAIAFKGDKGDVFQIKSDGEISMIDSSGVILCL